MTDLKTRSRVIDRVRGVAILLVMLGHTMTGSTAQAQGTFVFRVVWSLQMPLFFLISGYVTRYLKPLPNPAALLRQLGRRTLQLMLPFTVWTFLVRGLLFGQTGRQRFDLRDDGFEFADAGEDVAFQRGALGAAHFNVAVQGLVEHAKHERLESGIRGKR